MKANTKNRSLVESNLLNLGGILVPLEMGATDTSILKYLDFLITSFKVKEVGFLHVVPKIMIFGKALEFGGEASLLGDYQLNEDVIEQLKSEVLYKFSHHENTEKVFDVREGHPLEELLKEADVLEPDMILIGQNTDTSSHGILAKNLVRKIKCHAWVVPKGAPTRIKKILVPIDFSSYSIKALKMAATVADSLAGEIEIVALNIYDLPNFSTYRISRTPKQLKEMIEANREEGATNFINTHLKSAKAKTTVKMIERDMPGTGHYIVDYADDNEIDLIVMGAKGHSKVELLLLGSVTEKVLSMNRGVPVLVVK